MLQKNPESSKLIPCKVTRLYPFATFDVVDAKHFSSSKNLNIMRLFLVGELGGANVAAAQLDVENALHGT